MTIRMAARLILALNRELAQPANVRSASTVTKQPVAMTVTSAAHSCYNSRLQSLHCQFCKGFVNLNRRTVTDPERTVMLIEAFEEQHKDCKEFDNVPRSRAEQVWRRGMKLALVN